MHEIEPVGPVPPPTVSVVQTRPNVAFEKWVHRYAAIVCAVSHDQKPSPHPDLVEPCWKHRWEARQVAYGRLEETARIDGQAGT